MYFNIAETQTFVEVIFCPEVGVPCKDERDGLGQVDDRRLSGFHLGVGMS